MGTWLKLIIAIVTWVPVYRIYTCNSHLVTHLQHMSHDPMSTNVSHIDSDGHMYTHLEQPCAYCVMYWVISLLFIYYISIILKHNSINYFYEKKYFTSASSHFFAVSDMQGNVRALKYALGHELVYRDAAARLDRIQKPVPPYRKVRSVYVLSPCFKLFIWSR
jgi:hypothetical protein